jgi:hypothetical protein
MVTETLPLCLVAAWSKMQDERVAVMRQIRLVSSFIVRSGITAFFLFLKRRPHYLVD